MESKNRKSDLTKLKFATFISSMTFWISVGIAYMQFQQITTEQAYWLVGAYSLSIVIMEYPTGVIGDYYSHKLSLILGYLFSGISMLLFCLHTTPFVYFFVLFGLATGQSLISGSHNALFNSLSDDLKKDYPNLKSTSIIIQLLASVFGSIMFKFNPVLPVLLTGITLIISFALIISIKSKKENSKTKANIFAEAINGVKHSINNKYLISAILIQSIITVYLVSFKWISNPLFENLSLDKSFWGLVLGLTFAANAIGSRIIIKKNRKLKIFAASIFYVIAIVIAASIQIPIISIVSIVLSFIFGSFIQTILEVRITKLAKKQYTASIISFNSLLFRLLSTFYIWIGGIVIKNSSANIYLLATAIASLIALTAYIIFFVPAKKKLADGPNR
ncbi:MFS transporter [Candidatus Dojkabacteria bacterium]|nr:MFS transporter [Candidatus Dojkabacteria bacterium]